MTEPRENPDRPPCPVIDLQEKIRERERKEEERLERKVIARWTREEVED